MHPSLDGVLWMQAGIRHRDPAASAPTATVPDEIPVAIQDLIAEPPDYGRQKRTAERLPRLKVTAAPAIYHLGGDDQRKTLLGFSLPTGLVLWSISLPG
ncbi:MAG: hypothetical protein ABIR80_21745, partial [Opitutaceae bacterium]